MSCGAHGVRRWGLNLTVQISRVEGENLHLLSDLLLKLHGIVDQDGYSGDGGGASSWLAHGGDRHSLRSTRQRGDGRHSSEEDGKLLASVGGSLRRLDLFIKIVLVDSLHLLGDLLLSFFRVVDHDGGVDGGPAVLGTISSLWKHRDRGHPFEKDWKTVLSCSMWRNWRRGLLALGRRWRRMMSVPWWRKLRPFSRKSGHVLLVHTLGRHTRRLLVNIPRGQSRSNHIIRSIIALPA